MSRESKCDEASGRRRPPFLEQAEINEGNEWEVFLFGRATKFKFIHRYTKAILIYHFLNGG